MQFATDEELAAALVGHAVPAVGCRREIEDLSGHRRRESVC